MNQGAIEFFGIFTSVLIAAGLLPQYYEIFKRREVVGISIPFITIDWLGGIFSLISLLFRPKFDILAGVAYALVIVMDGVVILAALILNPLARKRRREYAQDSFPASDTWPEMGQSSAATSMRKPTMSLDPLPPGMNKSYA
ncbi:hypothetical protein C0991_009076 [Blastosporella zonata]|nr:hypothetical protein C0991_009076 [Blastosporella zonata]